MSALTVVELLWCGQGMTTLVQIYDDGNEKSAPSYLALIDCGGDAVDEAVDYIAGRVKAKADHTIGLLVVSHQDQDHVQGLTPLGKKLDGWAKLDEAFLGGLEWGESNMGHVLSFLNAVKYQKKVVFGTAEQSDYLKSKQTGSIAQHGAVHFRILVANVPGSGDSSMHKNTPSAVVVVDDGMQTVVLPGDATYQTMQHVNGLPNLNRVDPMLALAVPHHGALKTAVANYTSGAPIGTYDFGVITTFAKAMKPARVAASAGPDNSYKHPLAEVINVFDSVVQLDKHRYVAYDYADQDWSNYEATEADFCTVQYLGKPPKDLSPAIASGVARVKPHTGYDKFVHGDVVFRMAPKGVLRPEEIAEFRPRGTIGTYGAEDVVLTAPAP